jgi:hypothetical protein
LFIELMDLTDEQKREVAAWLASGAKLSDVQRRLADEFSIRLTYMEARLLVDDLNLVPQETAAPAEAKATDKLVAPDALPAGDLAATGGVRVALDKIMKPGTLVSGTVTFSDGVQSGWYLDQTGRLRLVPTTPGYRPSEQDLALFQTVLEQELTRQGL